MLDYLLTAGFTKTYDQLREEAPDLVFIPPLLPYHLIADLTFLRQARVKTRPHLALQQAVGQKVEERDQDAKKGVSTSLLCLLRK